MKILLLSTLTFFLIVPARAQSYYNKEKVNALPGKVKRAYRKTSRYLDDAVKGEFKYTPPVHSKIDTLFFSGDSLVVQFKAEFGYKPLRTLQVEDIYAQLGDKLGGLARRHPLKIRVKGYSLARLVPNYYREDKDPSRLMPDSVNQPVHVQDISKPYRISEGLNHRHIALWNSHGWYYNNRLDRWEWQRAPVFTTVEDVLPTSFVLPFLVPMLENAGANVYLPRERDTQPNEVIVDNQDSSYREGPYQNIFTTGSGTGFGVGTPPYVAGQNPFQQGDYRVLNLEPGSKAEVSWTPDIPADGKYAVYVSYKTLPNSSDKAHYEVRHAGGTTHFIVDQQMGGSTWVYLGTFQFKKGHDSAQGGVTLFANGVKGEALTADAVRFGGGMGDIARNGKVSGRPRWTEGARYYLQYCGFPDSLTYSFHKNNNDYVDDYQSRARWVNYLHGGKYMEPWITKGKNVPGGHIPIDLSLAFHTDAGHHLGTDTIVGTLAIYSTRDAEFNQKFPDGRNRLTNRDFADILSTQIVDDIRTEEQPNWTQRELWDKRYSEATYATIPSALLELLSHQNLGDMISGNDPEFRFVVARAIYKSMLKFLATYHEAPYIVQPLPVDAFSAKLDSGKAILAWHPVDDPLEPTAKPKKYVVYTRIGDSGWDNGVLVDQPEYETPALEQGKIYSYKITAVNEGGESFPSNILSVCDNGNDTTVMVVDAFDRVAAPEVIDQGNFTGFAGWLDEGVAWGNDLSTIGSQYNFNQLIPWVDNDEPGHGACYQNRTAMLPLGNNFDHVHSHGVAIRDAGYSFVSCSRKALENGTVSLAGYPMVDLIFGEEKTTDKPGGIEKFTLFTPEMQKVLSGYCASLSARLFISGAYVGSDTFEPVHRKVADGEKNFVKNVLGYIGRTDHASAISLVKATTGNLLPAFDGNFGFNMDYRPDMYRVESPDAIEPADSTGTTILRYVGNNKSAAVACDKGYKVITLGFPFETITTSEQRAAVMKEVLDYLSKK
ncbi:xanthan lyase [Prolixibacter sp. SD074]|uniref:golvesin C-terminal-like domain-containing protein n=1 Tax=Prolixibacter sp. SD074 TaxID=2652391 RepID=UPI0012848C75|nr:xanthan lyase [Prolixibacter sp. SD074]GET30104.1 xanthan lyase [Prolixibacter sp. SD074]